MLFDDKLRELLSAAQSIAIVGAKDKPGSPVEHVGRYLLEAGYRVFPVHPVRREVWGLPAFHSLADLPAPPDVICLFRAAQYCPDHAREALALPRLPLLFWMQEGITSPEAGKLMADAGVAVVEDMCIETVHKRLFPSSQRCFSCRRCGHSCSGRGGIVVGPHDLPRLADFFRMGEQDFLDLHTENLGGKPMLKTGPDGFCTFFSPDHGCSIHVVRPDVCRAWPYFRGNLVDKISHAMAQEDCPGIPADCEHPAFAREGFAYLIAHKLLARDPSKEGRALMVHEDELPRTAENSKTSPTSESAATSATNGEHSV